MTKEIYLLVIDTLGSLIVGTPFEGHVYSVGGCERDRLMGREIKDIDLVCDLPDGGIKLAKFLEGEGLTKGSVVTYEHFGTAMFHLKAFPEIELEAVQTRKECYHDIESRNPETAFGTIMDDCTRRDFTYNAIYHNISTNETCDFNGHSMEDLDANILRTCGDPDVIFTEDPLRILRACRFSSRFGSIIEPHTYNAMGRNVDRLAIISKERIAAEFDKMITCDKADYALRTLWEIGAMKYVLPELVNITKGEKKLIYSRMIVDNEKTAATQMAILLYGCKTVEEMLRDLKYSNDFIKEVLFYHKICHLIRERSFLLTESFSRKIQYACGTFEKYLQATKVYTIWRFSSYIGSGFWEDIAKRMMTDGTAMFGYTLPINGNDIMEILGIGPSKEVKTIINFLIEVAFTNPHITKETCVKIIKEKYGTKK